MTPLRWFKEEDFCKWFIKLTQSFPVCYPSQNLVNRLAPSTWLICKVMVANHTVFFQFALLGKEIRPGSLSGHYPFSSSSCPHSFSWELYCVWWRSTSEDIKWVMVALEMRPGSFPRLLTICYEILQRLVSSSWYKKSCHLGHPLKERWWLIFLGISTHS